MITVYKMRYGHPLWDKTADFAEKCSWRAGGVLAEKMRQNEFTGNERVFAAREEDRIVGFCTLSMKDELPDDSPYSPFVGFVSVDEKARGRRISGMMIEKAAARAKYKEYDTLYIMSGEKGLYEKYGFEKIGDFTTIYGTVDQLFSKAL